MKVSPSALLPILRSDAVGELLARLYVVPMRWSTITEVARDAGVSMPTATRELTRMVDAGLLEQQRVGKARLVRPNQRSLMYEPLLRLLELTYGPVPVLEQELRSVAGVAAAYIYGSWAARRSGEPGPAPNDVDVLVVGDPDPDDLYEAGERARRRLHREVNIRTVGADVWNEPQVRDPFLTHVRDSPLVELDTKDNPDPKHEGGGE